MKRAHALIVGGTKGAGRAAVRLFAHEGYTVSVLARHAPVKTRRPKPRVGYWAADILNPAAVRQALTEICKARGEITALVFFQRFRGSGDSWSGELETSLTATKQMIELLVDEFDLGHCSIVIVSSVNADLISQQLSVGYHVAKAGLNQMVRYYAARLGARGVRINSVSPGTFLKEESKKFFLKDRKLVALYEKMIPLGRMCRAEEVVQVVAFLCSARSSFVTGQNLIVDGGLTLVYQEALGCRLAASPKKLRAPR